MVIETERLLLREMTDNDFHALYLVWVFDVTAFMERIQPAK